MIMNDEKSGEDAPRTYVSPLRAEQAEATRKRILEAIVRLVGQGNQEFTYSAIAREARVSVPTVHRHFPTRQALFEAFCCFAEAQQAQEVPEDLSEEELRAMIHAFYARFDDPKGFHARASRLNTLFEMSRAVTVPRRRAVMTRILDRRAPGVPEPQRTWILDLAVVIASSATAESFRGYLDLSGAETADRVLFALDSLFAHGASLQPGGSP